MSQTAWTILVYMAADNDLASQGTRDLEEMLAVGSSPHLAVTVLADRKGRDATRYHIPPQPGGSLRNCPRDKMGKLNMGDPAVLTSFLEWGRRERPSRRRALVLWDHGDGWRPYNPLNPSGGLRTKAQFARRVRRVTRPGVRPQYIGFDDQGRGSLDNDWLDMGELRQALVQGAAGKPFDLLAFDACLMSQLEVLYEVRKTAKLILASEEEMPLTGLPYGQVLSAPAARPGISALGWAEDIIKAYLSWGPKRTRRTMSAIDPNAIEAVARATSELGDVLADVTRRRRRDVRAAVKNVQRYGTPDYADLVDLATRIATALGEDHIFNNVEIVKSAVCDAVIVHGSMGVRLEGAHGVSIYMPRRDRVWNTYRPSYQELDFARRFQGWTRFLDGFFESDAASSGARATRGRRS